MLAHAAILVVLAFWLVFCKVHGGWSTKVTSPVYLGTLIVVWTNVLLLVLLITLCISMDVADREYGRRN